MSCARKISSPDQRGRRQQVPGGPEPGHPHGLIFLKRLLKEKLCRMIHRVVLRFFRKSRTIWVKPKAIDSQELAESKDAPRA